MQRETIKLEKQIEQLVDRIVDSPSQTAVSAYERRIANLEKEKLILTEKQAFGVGPKRTFEEMFELAFTFLANPWKLWRSEKLEDKRTVLKLTFLERIPYDRKSGFRTPQVSEPFALFSKIMDKCEMVHPGRFELPTP